MSNIKMIALDLDGTTLTSEKIITPRTQKALRAAMEKGINVVIATGRVFAALPEEILNEVFDKNKPANPDGLPVPLQILVKFRGSVENVTAAVEAAKEAANAVSGVVGTHIIPAVQDGAEAMLHINAFDKN